MVENETQWHRAWKNYFPTEWQESNRVDSTTGEKHIADIKTDKGFVIEFQHSAIQPSEIQSREAFYKNMVWVVDGTRLKRDYPRFCRGFRDHRPTIVEGFFRLFFPEKYLPERWLGSSKPVYFDFQGTTLIDQPNDMRAFLWCLLPGRVDQCAVVACISRKQFIDFSSSNPHLLPTRDKFSIQEKNSQAFLAEAIEAAAKIKKIKAEQAAAHERNSNSLIPRRFMHRRL